MTYTYDPLKARARGKDQMRFELGDTQTEGGADTCALSDEEYEGMMAGLAPGRKSWLYAKLYTLEAIMFKLSYMVDTKIDVLTYGLGARAEQWRKLYEQLRKQILAMTGFPVMDARAQCKPYYFFTDMERNIRSISGDPYAGATGAAGAAGAPYLPQFPFRNMTQ